MVDTDDIVQIQVPVPRTRLPEFYEWFSVWLQADALSKDVRDWRWRSFVANESKGGWRAGNLSKAKRRETPTLAFRFDQDEAGAYPIEIQRPWHEYGSESDEWNGDELADAIYVYDKLSLNARRIIDLLLDHPGTPALGEVLGRHLFLSPSQLTGTLASVGLRSKAVRREVPFRYKPGPNGGEYWIEPDVASLFNWARSQAPELVEVAMRYHDLRARCFWDIEEAMALAPHQPGETDKGYPFLLDNDLHLGLEEASFELVRAHRSAAGQPEPEPPALLWQLRNASTQDGANERKEAWLS